MNYDLIEKRLSNIWSKIKTPTILTAGLIWVTALAGIKYEFKQYFDQRIEKALSSYDLYMPIVIRYKEQHDDYSAENLLNKIKFGIIDAKKDYPIKIGPVTRLEELLEKTEKELKNLKEPSLNV